MKTIIIILFFMALFIAAWIVVELGKPNRKRYNEKIIYLEGLIDQLPITNESCDVIMNAFDELNKFIDRDVKRNKAAFVKFCFRFKNIWNERISENG